MAWIARPTTPSWSIFFLGFSFAAIRARAVIDSRNTEELSAKISNVFAVRSTYFRVINRGITSASPTKAVRQWSNEVITSSSCSQTFHVSLKISGPRLSLKMVASSVLWSTNTNIVSSNTANTSGCSSIATIASKISSTIWYLLTTEMKLMLREHSFRILHVTCNTSGWFGYFTMISTNVLTASKSNKAWQTGS